jgi:hypothetical protein
LVGLAFDYAAHVLVASMSGTHVAADHERVYAAIGGLDRRGKVDARAVALLFVVAKGTESPDAHWRRRFAEQRKNFGSPHVFLAMVTDSALMRGVLTAMSWISPEPSHVTSATRATFEEAAAWIERRQGTPQFVLQSLLTQAARPAEGFSLGS